MDTSAKTITTMGIISDNVYQDKYFTTDTIEKGVKMEQNKRLKQTLHVKDKNGK